MKPWGYFFYIWSTSNKKGKNWYGVGFEQMMYCYSAGVKTTIAKMLLVKVAGQFFIWYKCGPKKNKRPNYMTSNLTFPQYNFRIHWKNYTHVYFVHAHYSFFVYIGNIFIHVLHSPNTWSSIFKICILMSIFSYAFTVFSACDISKIFKCYKESTRHFKIYLDTINIYVCVIWKCTLHLKNVHTFQMRTGACYGHVTHRF